ncbi:hypothetical protein [Flaviflexus huanghaiensis]|uniref:hypothetical protein n=1 Tax=Flaviflexus huanghaiensis TaxID=1111473 RepID=UPI0015FA3D4C|nr:hypothetical protein [Flaviflexus huanghaiensis]
MTEPMINPHGAPLIPLSLQLDLIAGMLNAELPDNPVYDGFELQWFDDDRHGTGMLVFLSRRDDRRVDYYQQLGLTIDRSGYEIGGGTRSWNVIDFDSAQFDVADDGVHAEVRFTDVDGRSIDIRIDDRDGRARHRGGLLAPVGANIEHPTNLLLVWMPVFDLVRDSGSSPVIRIDGVDAHLGVLPGAKLHRRHLIKYAAPLVALQVNPVAHSHLTTPPRQSQRWRSGLLTGVSTQIGEHEAELVLEPGLPDLTGDDVSERSGRWHVTVDDVRLTGGVWRCRSTYSGARMLLEVDERWKPGPLPWLMRIVTRIIPVFRRWPTTYRWAGEVRHGDPPTLTGRWHRTGRQSADVYAQATRPRP